MDIPDRQVLARLLANVLDHPGDMKYRQIKLANKTIGQSVLGLV